MRHIFIINPVSGKEDAGRAMAPRIEKAAAECGITPEFVLTEYPGHATALAERYAQEGPVRLYAVGGDGTLNEIFNGAWRSPTAEVASIPCGSGNDFVRNWGKAEDFLDLPSVIKGKAIPIDLMETEKGVCAAITSTGLDAEVAYNIPKYRRIPGMGGSMAYNISIVEKILKPLGKTLHLTIDGKELTGRYLIAAVCNGRTYGGGYIAAPYGQLDDGILEIILVKKVSRLRIASIIGAYKNGKHFDENGKIVPRMQKYVFHYRAKEVIIKPAGTEPFILNIDGECGPSDGLYAKVMPLAARFVLPSHLSR